MKTKDLAYLAGFVEADGSMGVYCQHDDRWSHGRTTHYQPRLTVSQKDPQILYWIKRLVGAGSVHRRGHTSKNNVRYHQENIMHNYVVSGKPAQDLVAELLPFLKIKKPAAYRLMLGV